MDGSDRIGLDRTDRIGSDRIERIGLDRMDVNGSDRIGWIRPGKFFFGSDRMDPSRKFSDRIGYGSDRIDISLRLTGT